jgi:hypothetical protein
MIPYTDMFNNDSNFNLGYWAFEQGATGLEFFAKATKDIKRGEELLLDYGNKSYSGYLILYGFLPKDIDDQKNYVLINIRLKETPEEAWKIKAAGG